MPNERELPDEMVVYAASRYTGKPRLTILMAHALGKVRGRVVGGRLYLDRRDLESLKAQRETASAPVAA